MVLSWVGAGALELELGAAGGEGWCGEGNGEAGGSSTVFRVEWKLSWELGWTRCWRRSAMLSVCCFDLNRWQRAVREELLNYLMLLDILAEQAVSECGKVER